MSTGSSSASPPDGGESSTTAAPNWEWSTEKSINTLTCCRKCGPQAALQLQTVNDDREKLALQTELEATKAELEKTKAKLESLNKATKQAQASKELSGSRLVRCYGNLYSQARVEALEKLDTLPQLTDATELKSKILFSVVVLAFRSTQAMLNQKKEQVKRMLFYPTPASSAHVELESSICTYLRRTVDTFDLTQCIEEVSSQLWATLYDYPCLKTCTGLHQYICDAVRLAWALVNQTPSYVLEYEQRSFKRDLHVKYHSSNLESNQVRTYLWPALLEGPTGPCVHKAVVLT
jgi:hypothetical protein